MPCNGAADSQVREYLRTWSTKSLATKTMRFSVCVVLHTWEYDLPMDF